MKTRKTIIISVVGLLLIFVGFIFRTFIQVNIIEPAAFLLWALWRALESVNQNVYWQILIWGSIFLLIRFLPSRKITQTAYHHRNNSKEISGSLYWHRLFLEARFSPEKRDLLHFELENMLINLLMMREKKSKEEIQSKLLQKEYPFPPYILQYFSHKETSWETFLRNQFLKVCGHFPGWLQEYISKPYSRKNRQIIKWMQTQMESGYENITPE